MPDADAFPTGGDLVSAYLEPLATTPELTAVIETNVRVTAISRHGLDKVVSREREARPFVLIVKVGASIRRDLARAVVDASGTWATPNPVGASGLPAVGEAEFADQIRFKAADQIERVGNAIADEDHGASHVTACMGDSWTGWLRAPARSRH